MSYLNEALGGNLMQKLATAIVEIIEAMASNFYNGTGDRRILIKQARVQ